MYIHGFPCCVSRDDPEARSTHAAPRSWFLPTSNKRSWDSWGKWLILDVEQEIYKVILEHLVVAEKFKKCSKKKRERERKSPTAWEVEAVTFQWRNLASNALAR